MPAEYLVEVVHFVTGILSCDFKKWSHNGCKILDVHMEKVAKTPKRSYNFDIGWWLSILDSL